MKFQSVRISGFKSFLEPTEIQMSRGLTGVVGPNGCGKSNIVEAIKWIMGENSARQMRGDGMDDVIFSGTDERPSRNFAEVTIKLDNSEKKAPAIFNHYDEIEITRKIEREKGSVYRVNGKQVRARDIQLIFADNGTGARSSGIVGQGRIAQIIDSNPEDRRVILEEAANIKGLHSRRHEAELKLKGASDNLDRLSDIEQTYKEQLIELEKQGRKAARYRSVGERIRKAEATLFFNLMNNAKKEANDLDVQLKNANENVSQGQIKVAEHTKSQLHLANKIPDLKKDEAEKAAILQTLNITKIKLDEEKSSAQNALQNIINQINLINNDIVRESEIKEDAKKSLSTLLTEEKNLKEDSENFSTKITKATDLVKKLRSISDAANDKLSTITSEIYSIKSDKSDLEKRIKNLKQKIEVTQNQLANFNIEDDKNRFKLDKEKIINLKKLIQENNQLNDGYNVELEKLEKLETRLVEEKNTAVFEFNKVNLEFDSLSTLLGRDTLNSNTLEKTIGNINNLEEAIGSVLGETLLAPILSDDQSTENATYWRDDFKTISTASLPESVIPIVTKITKSSILDTALKGVGIVDNKEIAFKLQKELTFGQALTTPSGGLWRWDGFVQPQGVQNSYSERLQQIARLRLLQNKLPSLEENQSLSEKKLEECFKNIKKYKDDLANLQVKLSNLISESNELELQNTKVESKLLSSEALIKELKNTERVSLEELSELEKEFNNSLNLPSLLAEELKVRNNADQSRNELTDAMAAEQQIKSEESFKSRNLIQLGHQKENWKVREEEAKTRLISLEERLKASQDEKNRLSTLPESFEKKEAELNTKIEEAISNRNIAADQLVKNETSLNDADKLVREAEKAVSTLREEMIKIEALLNLSKAKIQNIEDRVFEKLKIKSTELNKFINSKEEDQPIRSIEILEKTLQRLLNERETLGAVNLRAEDEMNEMLNKIEVMSKERVDLEEAIAKLRSGIFELNKEGRQRLKESFEEVNENFKQLFQKLFGGGNAELRLVGNEDPLQAGLEVLASPPGKKMQLLSLLSGGEQALTAISLIFSVFLCNPAPICILDEVDAPLDDTNVGRFCDLLNQIVDETNTYFMVITHHRLTMAKMDRLFGVTMEQRGISKLVSVDLEQASRIRDIA
ncbi:MAG: chromosome segregation protein SMC [Alphaproteobacteria bacterium]|nr:chromosome segregation protein SMC [Alphaproteobacteria bacterium]